MTSIIGPVLSLGIDATAAQRGAQQFQAATSQISSSGQRVSQTINGVDTSFTKIGSSLTSLTGYLKAAAAAFAAFTALNVAKHVLDIADSYSQLDARLKLVLGSTENATKAHQDLQAAASATGTSFEATATLFTRVARSSEQLGLSYEQLLDLTDLLNKSITVSGASSEEAASGLFQLSQALAAGTLQGDEFRSIMENFPYLAGLIADSLGVPIGKLRELASQGKITSDVIVKSVLSQRDAINSSFSEMGTTVGRSTQAMQNAWDDLLATFAKSSNASSTVISSIQEITAFLQSPQALSALEEFAKGVRIIINDLTTLATIAGGVGSAISALGDSSSWESLDSLRANLRRELGIGDHGATGSWGSDTSTITTPVRTPARAASILPSTKSRSITSNAATSEIRDQQRAIDALATSQRDLLNSQIDYYTAVEDSAKVYELQRQQLDMTHAAELKQLEEFKLSADQKNKLIDSLTEKYKNMQRTLDVERGGQLIKDQNLPSSYNKNTRDSVLFSSEFSKGANFGTLDIKDSTDISDNLIDWQRYHDLIAESTDATDNLASGTRSFVNDLSGGFADAIIAGDSLIGTFSNLTGAIIQATLKAIVFQGIMSAIGSGTSGGGGLFGSLGGLFGGGAGGGGFELGSLGTTPIVAHRGGMVGGPGFSRRGVSASTFIGAPHFATGGVAGYEVPAILHKGEGVFTPGQMAAMGKNNVTVNVINNTDVKVSTSKNETDDGLSINVIIDRVEEALASRVGRNGTPLNSAIRNVGSVNSR
jgi:tape measure domain-containing protein